MVHFGKIPGECDYGEGGTCSEEQDPQLDCVLVTKIFGRTFMYPVSAPHHEGHFLKLLTYMEWHRKCECKPYAGHYPQWSNPTNTPPLNKFDWTGTRRVDDFCTYLEEIGQPDCGAVEGTAVPGVLSEFKFTRETITGWCISPGIGEISPYVQDCCSEASGIYCYGFGDDGDCTMTFDEQDFALGLAGEYLDGKGVFQGCKEAINNWLDNSMDELWFCDQDCSEG